MNGFRIIISRQEQSYSKTCRVQNVLTIYKTYYQTASCVQTRCRLQWFDCPSLADDINPAQQINMLGKCERKNDWDIIRVGFRAFLPFIFSIRLPDEWRYNTRNMPPLFWKCANRRVLRGVVNSRGVTPHSRSSTGGFESQITKSAVLSPSSNEVSLKDHHCSA